MLINIFWHLIEIAFLAPIVVLLWPVSAFVTRVPSGKPGDAEIDIPDWRER